MKKLTISSAFLTLAVLIMSCKKQVDIVTQPFAGTEVTNASSNTQTVISGWFWLYLNAVSDRGETYLQGIKSFDSRVEYNTNTHIELAYASMPGQRIPVIKRLPMKLKISQFVISQNSQDDIYSFQFSMGNSGFNLSVKNASDPSLAPDPTIIQDFKYRYIIIPRQLYQTLAIDWDNYNEVANALNL
jgi:hypothetical protein